MVWLTLPEHSAPVREVRAGAQGKSLKARTEVETTEKH